MLVDQKDLERIVRDAVNRNLPASPTAAQGRARTKAAQICDVPGGRSLKRKLAAGEVSYGLWITLESPTLTEIAARLGFDWVVIDAEHGHLDLKVVMEHVRVANLSGLTAIVRVADIQPGMIKRVMDIGADGIMVPQARNAEEMAAAVSYAKYPPEGIRGIGAERSTRWAFGIEPCVKQANAQTVVIPLLETADAARDIGRILGVPGIDALFLGPHDFAATSGYLGATGHPEVTRQLDELRERAKAAGRPVGIMAFSLDDIAKRRAEGFLMIGLGIDTGFFVRAAREALGRTGKTVPTP